MQTVAGWIAEYRRQPSDSLPRSFMPYHDQSLALDVILKERDLTLWKSSAVVKGPNAESNG